MTKKKNANQTPTAHQTLLVAVKRRVVTALRSHPLVYASEEEYISPVIGCVSARRHVSIVGSIY